jgi:hypothetical protein
MNVKTYPRAHRNGIDTETRQPSDTAEPRVVRMEICTCPLTVPNGRKLSYCFLAFLLA